MASRNDIAPSMFAEAISRTTGGMVPDTTFAVPMLVTLNPEPSALNSHGVPKFSMIVVSCVAVASMTC